MNMVSEIHKGLWSVENEHGDTFVVPFEVVPYRVASVSPNAATFADYIDGEAIEWTAEPFQYAARLTMPGYLDSTEWSVHGSARAALLALWEDGCPQCGSDQTDWNAVDPTVPCLCLECGYEEGVR